MTMTNGRPIFEPAERKRLKLRLALIGPTGSGKTMTALRVARGLVGPAGRIAVIDTEHESAALYSDAVAFDVLGLSDHSPQSYLSAIRAAEDAGYDAIVIDSLSHAWAGRGGILEQADALASKNRGDKFGSWRTLTPQHNALVDALVRCKAHLIATMRAKMDYILEEYTDASGRKKQKPVKVGLGAVQRDGVEYEFTIVADIDLDHRAIVSKTRWSDIDNAVIEKPGEEFGARIRAWLDSGSATPPANGTTLPRAPQTATPATPPAVSSSAGAEDEPPPHDDADAGPPQDDETPWGHAREAAAVKAAEAELGAKVESVSPPKPTSIYAHAKAHGFRDPAKVDAIIEAQFGRPFKALAVEEKKQAAALIAAEGAKLKAQGVAIVRGARGGA